jgi:hypothetical protein
MIALRRLRPDDPLYLYDRRYYPGPPTHIGARVGYYTVILAELGDAPIPSR